MLLIAAYNMAAFLLITGWKADINEKALNNNTKLKNNVDNLLKENVKLIVIACNTATTKCIKILREQYPNDMIVFTGSLAFAAYVKKLFLEGKF